MKQNIKMCFVATLLFTSCFANAEWSTSGSYSNYNEFEVGVASLSIAYTYDESNYSITPELRIGTGIGDTDIGSLAGFVSGAETFEIDEFVSVSIRGQYKFDDYFGIFIQPSYSQLGFSVSGNGIAASDDDTEFNIGLGANYRFNDNISVEVIYEPLYNNDVVSFGVRYTF